MVPDTCIGSFVADVDADIGECSDRGVTERQIKAS
jgi:hypothetical protein